MTEYRLADKISGKRHYKAYKLNGYDLNGSECYYIIACAPHKLEFILANDIEDLSQHADILASGLGQEAPQEVFDMIKEKYKIEFAPE